jgi:cytochrome c553
MPFRRCAIAFVSVALAGFGSSARGETAPRDPAVELFEKKVRPILVGHCYTCHSADTNSHGGLRVDDRNGLLTGGKSGPAVVPGDPARSLLIQRVTHKDAKQRMPKEGQPLTEAQIADLTAWIKDGAAWPAVRLPASLGKPKPAYDKLRKEHWAWQPLTDPKVPALQDTAWPRDDIDRFLLARLEAKRLAPVADADRVTLIRRLTFDLTGVPPTLDEIDTFLQDASADAYEKLADRLLASPAFGERWGRHWLDVARYGESTGPSRNIPYPHAWKYRDYVIDAVNADVPFDQFIREQVAGDLLPASGAERDRLLTATGFLALGVKDVNQRFKVRFVMDNVDEQIDAVSRSVLALTVSCARCHDHKFDPIPTTDYYALAGIFTSTDNCAGVRNKMGGGGLDYYDPSMLVAVGPDRPPAPPEQVAKLKGELAQAKKEWDAIRGTPEGLAKGADGQPKQRPYRLKYERLEAELAALTDPLASGRAVHGVRDAKTVGDTEVRVRGEAEKVGPAVPRGFLTAFDVPGAARVNPSQSGRLELARWLTSPNNSLTARVIVNRVWQHLFGQGIVTTVDNFGTTGDTPSHPELLDHLARRFVRDGWSVKRLVRTIVLTRAYGLGSDAPAAHRAADPANRLVWRHAPRRLDAEELRDAMVASAGTLDRRRPTGSPAMTLKMVEMADNGAEARNLREQADRSTQRSVYLPLLRGVTPHALEAFDPVEQALVTGRRDATTVPGQALFLLNSSFVRRQALALGERLLADAASDADRVRRAYRLTLGRLPSEKEVERARAYLAEYEAAARDLPASGPDDKDAVRPKDARSAAWMSFAQALMGSAEFRYVK